MLSIRWYPYDLTFSRPFSVSLNTRTKTELIFVEIQYGNLIGYGQASFPPYMTENRTSNIQFLTALRLQEFKTPYALVDIQTYLDSVSPANQPAKAAINMALYDLIAKELGVPLYKLFGFESIDNLKTSYTIGMGKKEFVEGELNRARDFYCIKVKLGNDIETNKDIINFISNSTGQTITIDFNQAYSNGKDCLKMLDWLACKNVQFIEQPYPDSFTEEYLVLKKKSPLRIIGDESIQTADDIVHKAELFHGVNIKLMKCGGITGALESVQIAKKLRLTTMIGCMAESSCAITAAAHIALHFDQVDLDGSLHTSNDPFSGIKIINGEICMSKNNGIGITQNQYYEKIA